MSELTLYSCPSACSLVSHIALEMTGASFSVEFVDLLAGRQHTPEYLAISPRGKVPALKTAKGVITENAVILVWLAQNYPESGLLPDLSSKAGIHTLSDLGWFASGVHPHITRIVVPSRFVGVTECQSSVRTLASQALSREFAIIDARLAGRSWWLDKPSGADAYVFWLWARTSDTEFDASPFSHIATHAQRMMDLPATRKALARERSFRPCFAKFP